MPSKEIISAADGLRSPLLSQATKYGDTIYVSGCVGMDFTAMRMIEGSVSDRTVCNGSCIGGCEIQYLLPNRKKPLRISR